MLKKVMAMALTGMVLCSATAGAYAADIVETPVDQSVSQTASNSNPGIMPMNVVIQGQDIYEGVSGAWDDTTVTVPGEGQIFRIWFENKNTVSAHVHVFIVNGSNRTEVINYQVQPGQGAWREYTFSDEKPEIFYVRITTDSGTIVKGYVAAMQAPDSAGVISVR